MNNENDGLTVLCGIILFGFSLMVLRPFIDGYGASTKEIMVGLFLMYAGSFFIAASFRHEIRSFFIEIRKTAKHIASKRFWFGRV